MSSVTAPGPQARSTTAESASICECDTSHALTCLKNGWPANRANENRSSSLTGDSSIASPRSSCRQEEEVGHVFCPRDPSPAANDPVELLQARLQSATVVPPDRERGAVSMSKAPEMTDERAEPSPDGRAGGRGINQITLVGRLARDPELRNVGDGVPRAWFVVAVPRGYAGKDGDRDAGFINVVAWRATASVLWGHPQKGPPG